MLLLGAAAVATARSTHFITAEELEKWNPEDIEMNVVDEASFERYKKGPNFNRPRSEWITPQVCAS